MAWLGVSDKIIKRLDISNGISKTEAVVMAAARTGLGGDGGNEMTVMVAAQAWLVIIRWQQRDNSNCGNNGGGASLSWLGGSGNMDRRQKKQQ